MNLGINKIISLTLLSFFMVYAVGNNIHFYNEVGNYFGKEDVLNYVQLNDEPDIWHVFTSVFSRITGKQNFFNILMPLSATLGFYYAYSRYSMNPEAVLFMFTGTGVFLFSWIVGLYSQVFAHILFLLGLRYHDRTLGHLFIIASVIFHPIFVVPALIFLVVMYPRTRVYLMLLWPIPIVILADKDLRYFFYHLTILKNGVWDYYTAFTLLINPLIMGLYMALKRETKLDDYVAITFVSGLFTGDFRLSMVVLPLIAYKVYMGYPKKVIYPVFLFSFLWLYWCYSFHISAMVYEYKIIGLSVLKVCDTLGFILVNDVSCVLP